MSRLDEARKILGELGFDQERCNARSAHVLLALLRIDPVTPWKLADNPMMGTRAIMDWIRDEFGVDYKPNTRETIRRQTLHQFVEAGLVEENQDKPDRPINSPKWNHRCRIDHHPEIRETRLGSDEGRISSGTSRASGATRQAPRAGDDPRRVAGWGDCPAVTGWAEPPDPQRGA